MAEQNAQNYWNHGYCGQPAQGFSALSCLHTVTQLTVEEKGSNMPAIELRNVTKKFATADGGADNAPKHLPMTVEDGQFCAVVGPTGCGKSTTLTLVSGLERPSTGEAFVHGQAGRGVETSTGFVFQQDAVFPWKSVLDNVAAGPLFRGTNRSEANTLARDWLRRVGLSGFEDRYPHQLSRGMRKRVALPQTLINH